MLRRLGALTARVLQVCEPPIELAHVGVFAPDLSLDRRDRMSQQ
jgi:hypothetical protein